MLEIETKHSVKLNKPKIFNNEDKLYPDANNTCHICSKTCIHKVKYHCHDTGKYRDPACNFCNLNYSQQNIIPVIFHSGKSYDFNLIFNEIFNRMIVKE